MLEGILEPNWMYFVVANSQTNEIQNIFFNTLNSNMYCTTKKFLQIWDILSILNFTHKH